MANAKIKLRNLNWLRTASVIDGKGTIHGVKIAELFDDVNVAFGQLAAQIGTAPATAPAAPAVSVSTTTVISGGGGGGGGGSTGPNFSDAETPSGSGLNYTLAHAPDPAESLVLVLNGSTLTQGQDYTLSGANITMVSDPGSGNFQAWYRYGSGGASANFADSETPSGSLTGTAFMLAHAPSPALSLELVLNGLTLTQGQDYTLSGNAITMNYAPGSSSNFQAWYRY